MAALPSPVHVDDGAAADLALEDLAAQVEQVGEAGLRGHGVELVHGQVGGEPGPGGATDSGALVPRGA